MRKTMLIACCLFTLLLGPQQVWGHGRLVEPPSRSSMWRFGFKTKPNYNDNELFCGGYTVQWQRNRGKCGVCGDAWHHPQPRPNEAGGTYGQGIITRRYSPGQAFTSTVELTANHRGFFEFKICPHNSPKTIVSQDCLDRTLLQLADGSGTRYYPTFGTGKFNVQLKLPSHVTCSQCVFQWTYTAGNNWGSCENGTSKVGCGPQETFRGCSDIAIGSSDNNDIPLYNADPPPFGPSISSIPTRKSPPRRRPKPVPTKPNGRRPNIKTSQRPYYNRRPTTSRKPSSVKVTQPTSWWSPQSTKWQYQTTAAWSTTRLPKRKTDSKRPTGQYPSKRRPQTNNRRVTEKPHYSKPKASTTKKPRPTYKPKPTTRKTYIESEDFRWSCKATGAWSGISGIAEWCEANCPRGYCPASHCDCSKKKKK